MQCSAEMAGPVFFVLPKLDRCQGGQVMCLMEVNNCVQSVGGVLSGQMDILLVYFWLAVGALV